MDKKFLDKVVDQIVSETRFDYDEEMIYFPFYFRGESVFNRFSSIFHDYFSTYFPIFHEHCEDIYGLNKQEGVYVWKKYIKILKDKIENGL